jgi:hypothetical protein
MKKSFEDELMIGMQQELVKQASGDVPDLSKAAECLHAALEIFEEQGLNARANQLTGVLLKIAQTHKSKPVQQLPSMKSLMHAGLTQRDLHEFSKGNPVAKAKFNLVLRSMGMSEHEIGRLIGPTNVMSEDKAKEVINPNAFQMTSLLQPSAPPVQEGGEALEFKSLAQKVDPATKGLTSEKQVKNLKEFGVPLNVNSADDFDFNLSDTYSAEDELMSLDIKEDSLEVFDDEDAQSDWED